MSATPERMYSIEEDDREILVASLGRKGAPISVYTHSNAPSMKAFVLVASRLDRFRAYCRSRLFRSLLRRFLHWVRLHSFRKKVFTGELSGDVNTFYLLSISSSYESRYLQAVSTKLPSRYDITLSPVWMYSILASIRSVMQLILFSCEVR